MWIKTLKKSGHVCKRNRVTLLRPWNWRSIAHQALFSQHGKIHQALPIRQAVGSLPRACKRRRHGDLRGGKKFFTRWLGFCADSCWAWGDSWQRWPDAQTCGSMCLSERWPSCLRVLEGLCRHVPGLMSSRDLESSERKPRGKLWCCFCFFFWFSLVIISLQKIRFLFFQ